MNIYTRGELWALLIGGMLGALGIALLAMAALATLIREGLIGG